jgi:membrane-associated phospholipid phosphatase
MRQVIMLMLSAGVALGAADAQTTTDTLEAPQKTFFIKRDFLTGGLIVGTSGVFSIFDERFERWTQSTSVQHPGRKDLAESLTWVNERPLTIAAAATYAVGRVVHNQTISDVGAHWTETMVLTVAMSEVARISIGRHRPRATDGDAFSFAPFEGLRRFEARSYPSLHAAAAFATASALSEEIKVRNPDAARYARPALYAAALVPGFTRLYLNEHWLSDVVAGTLLGTFIGNRVVHYAHSHQRNSADRILLGASIVPTANGRALMMSVLPSH